MRKTHNRGHIVLSTILAVILIISLPRWHSKLVANLRILPFVKIAAAQTSVCYFDSSQLDANYVFTAAQFERDEQKSRLVETPTSEVAPFGSYLTLFWNSAFSLTVDLPVQRYEMQLYGKHDRPGPVVLQIFANDRILGVPIFDKDDDSWGSQCLGLPPDYWLDSEKLTVQVRFVNDGGVAGDRDASIAWIRFTPLLPTVFDQ